MSEKDVDSIGKADSPESNFDAEIPFSAPLDPVNSNKPPVWVWFSVGGLLIIALLVIFVLPTVVSEYELPLERRVDLAPVLPVDSADEPSVAISPFEEAQRSLQRKEAQDVLAELLEIQGELDGLEVERWGQAEYEGALEQASIGDEYYRTQDFLLAARSYSSGRDGLAALVDTIPVVLSQNLIDGQRALDGLDAAAAQDSFSLALLLDPANETARVGLQRARALDEVTGLFASAEDLLGDGELEGARELYRQILDMDEYYEPAQRRITEVNGLIRQAEFAGIMSRGYALLEGGDPEQAIAAFQQAAGLGINPEQALAAITQTENDLANVQINAIRELIADAEAGERWQDAVNEYDRALAIDGNLIFAINGRDYADKRARLDQLLVDAIANPERFAEDAVFEQTLDVYYTGRAIENPGPVLQAQLDELLGLLENSQVPIEIRLVSDNLTDVTLLRIGNLGAFEQTSLELKPGRYVAVGRRIGYREVREEFTVGFGLTPEAVVVQCSERVIVSGR